MRIKFVQTINEQTIELNKAILDSVVKNVQSKHTGIPYFTSLYILNAGTKSQFENVYYQPFVGKELNPVEFVYMDDVTGIMTP